MGSILSLPTKVLFKAHGGGRSIRKKRAHLLDVRSNNVRALALIIVSLIPLPKVNGKIVFMVQLGIMWVSNSC